MRVKSESRCKCLLQTLAHNKRYTKIWYKVLIGHPPQHQKALILFLFFVDGTVKESQTVGQILSLNMVWGYCQLFR